jgi:UDP-galactopyranose mutase
VRTYFHGGHPFTYGPRHFLSPYREAYEFMMKYVPLRDIKKINYTFVEGDGSFYTYPPHADDIVKMPEKEEIRKELEGLPEEGGQARNFEEFYQLRLGDILYGKFVKEYNRKAWLLNSNTEMDFGFEATVKRRPLESGDRYEFRDWFNCYPIPYEGYNNYFDICVEGCEVILNTVADRYDLDLCAVWIGDRKIEGDIMISAISPDELLEFQYGELKYVGRDFYKIMLPIEEVLPKDVYFVYYPNENEAQTRIVEFKKFTQYKSPWTLLTLEVPSLNNKLYPTMIQSEIDKAQKYIDQLPSNIFSLGRMGTYRYVDMDNIIIQAKEFVAKI